MSEGFARLYDPMMAPLERFWLAGWRADLMSRLHGEVLEVGAGTGVNFAHYPPGLQVTATEPDPAMRAHAARRATALGRKVPLLAMAAEELGFEDGRFDTVFATLVFCAVPEPVVGLRELLRVLKPGGQLILLEHTRSSHGCLNCLLRGLTALTARSLGEHFDRDTARAVREAGFTEVEATCLGLAVFHRIVARRPLPEATSRC